jgi:hypothetical protein
MGLDYGSIGKKRGNVFDPPEPPPVQLNQSALRQFQRDVSKWVAMHENLILTGHSKGLQPSQHIATGFCSPAVVIECHGRVVHQYPERSVKV